MPLTPKFAHRSLRCQSVRRPKSGVAHSRFVYALDFPLSSGPPWAVWPEPSVLSPFAQIARRQALYSSTNDSRAMSGSIVLSVMRRRPCDPRAPRPPPRGRRASSSETASDVEHELLLAVRGELSLGRGHGVLEQ